MALDLGDGLAPTRDAGVSVVHAAVELVAVTVDSYNVELRDGDGFIGDRASKRAFRAMVEESRERLRDVAKDPLGDTPTDDLNKKKLDKLLTEGEPEAAGVIQGAIEEFSSELATIVTRLLTLKEWRRTQRIVVGGGLRASRVGELVIGRSSVLVKQKGHDLDLVPIHNDPDEAGLIGAVHLAPAWMFAGHDAVLALDIGGSNVRAGVVGLPGKKKPDLDRCAVKEMELWRYADEATKPTRDDTVKRICEMVTDLKRWAKRHDCTLAPFIGVACPGVIAADGHIERGGQNLPGNWESSRFNLPQRIRDAIPRINDHDTLVVMHNDAVVQGLSELPFVDDVAEWAVLTIGTGLGNAKFTNRRRRQNACQK
jgi:predicted NBD/HSP70 family sugar kinase